ncbi:cysteine desulfurase family protein [Geothermobacter ehrlichii]|uniref:cysteine desulfurase n=1 Tax=Geothermobacter ehrlichii TaxID=213224 RepID=A0A5D3WKT5_9BACT|nr:aminotransferase class V-fold PLP-dependent enzyme [Geothermobacter ehrlichii]TYO99627.1 cysteine desulfurase family protein [Geothermobacter ehrlichii]
MAIYLDNAATSFPKPDAVCEAVGWTLKNAGGNPGRGGHGFSLEAGRVLFEARETVARFFGVADSERIALLSSATEAINLALFGWLRPGDRVLTTRMEHNAVSRPLNALADRGVQVVRLPCDADGRLSLDALRREAGVGARLMVLCHCSNVTGTLQPLEEIVDICNRYRIPVLVDAAQSAGHFPLDIGRLGVDMLAAPGHKGLLGPAGTGFLYLRPGIELQPLIYGGTGINSTAKQMPEQMPERFEAGTRNVPGLAGLAAGIRYLETAGPQLVEARLSALTGQLLEGLAGIGGVKVFGPGPEEKRGSVVSFVVEGRDPAEFAFRLDREFAICCRAGLHCAPDAHRTIGSYPEGTVRLSPGPLTTQDEIGQALEAVRALARIR